MTDSGREAENDQVAEPKVNRSPEEFDHDMRKADFRDTLIQMH